MYKENHIMKSSTIYADVRAIKSRRLVGVTRISYKIFILKISLKGPPIQGIVRAIILKLILEKWVVRL